MFSTEIHNEFTNNELIYAEYKRLNLISLLFGPKSDFGKATQR